jgi:hypothetical protein
MVRLGCRGAPTQHVIGAESDEANDDHTRDEIEDYLVKRATPIPHPKCLTTRAATSNRFERSQATDYAVEARTPKPRAGVTPGQCSSDLRSKASFLGRHRGLGRPPRQERVVLPGFELLVEETDVAVQMSATAANIPVQLV